MYIYVSFSIYSNACMIAIQIVIQIIFSHPPKRRRVTYANGIRPASVSASASTLL